MNTTAANHHSSVEGESMESIHLSKMLEALTGMLTAFRQQVVESHKLHKLGVQDKIAAHTAELMKTPSTHSLARMNHQTQSLLRRELDMSFSAWLKYLQDEQGLALKSAYRVNDSGPRSIFYVVLDKERNDDLYVLNTFSDMFENEEFDSAYDIFIDIVDPDLESGISSKEIILKDGEFFPASRKE